MEVFKSRVATGKLILPASVLSRMKSNKSIGMIQLPPLDFLKLTTPNDERIEEIVDESSTLAQYNEWAKERVSLLSPWLDISCDDQNQAEKFQRLGKISGHEGRHRAAACLKYKCKWMPVALFAQFYGHNTTSVYKDGKNVKVTLDDIPNILISQFRNFTLDITHAKKSFRAF